MGRVAIKGQHKGVFQGIGLVYPDGGGGYMNLHVLNL